jgi:hypothetical protein
MKRVFWLILVLVGVGLGLESKEKASNIILSGDLEDDPFEELTEEELQKEWSR